MSEVESSPNTFIPTDEQRESVEIAIACGMSERDVAVAVGICRETLRKYFAQELLTGRAKKRFQLYSEMWKTATDGNVSMQKHLESHLAAIDGGETFREKAVAAADPKLGKKEAALLAAQTPDRGSALGDLIAQRQGGENTTH